MCYTRLTRVTLSEPPTVPNNCGSISNGSVIAQSYHNRDHHLRSSSNVSARMTIPCFTLEGGLSPNQHHLSDSSMILNLNVTQRATQAAAATPIRTNSMRIGSTLCDNNNNNNSDDGQPPKPPNRVTSVQQPQQQKQRLG